MHKSILILKKIYIAHSNTPNISLNHLITPCKPPACSKTTHHKTNFQHRKYRVLQVFKSNKILFITSNQQYSFTFARIEKHSQYVFKPPYNIMQTICLLQHKTNHKQHNYNAYKYWNQIKYYSSHLINKVHSHL